jgi:hypothetical protein
MRRAQGASIDTVNTDDFIRRLSRKLLQFSAGRSGICFGESLCGGIL